MFRYEILVLTIPEITKDETSTLEFQVDKLIRGIKGATISFERWGKYRLAYPVKKNDYGVYFLVRFETEEKRSISKDLNTLFVVKFSDIVMRNLVSSIGPNQSLDYEKPPSLEDTPRRHISSFIEEKGLLKSQKTKGLRSSEKVKEEPKASEELVKASSEEEKSVVAKKEQSTDSSQPKKKPVSDESKEV